MPAGVRHAELQQRIRVSSPEIHLTTRSSRLQKGRAVLPFLQPHRLYDLQDSEVEAHNSFDMSEVFMLSEFKLCATQRRSQAVRRDGWRQGRPAGEATNATDGKMLTKWPNAADDQTALPSLGSGPVMVAARASWHNSTTRSSVLLSK